MLRKETGQVLPMALIILLLGAAVIIPTLSFTTTNLKATQSVDQHTREFYAADAGIDNALWYLQSDDRTKIINPTLQWPSGGITYHLWDFQPAETVNNRDVRVNIETAWLLGGLPGTTIPMQQPSPNASYTLIGAIDIDHNTAQQRRYITDISTKGTGTELLEHIGVWMPQGYSYVAGSVRINGIPIGGPGTNYILVKNPVLPAQSWRSGNVYKWSYLGTTFKSLSDVAPLPGGGQPPAAKFPPSVRLSFDYYYNGAPSKEAQLFFPWIQLANGTMAWDTAAGFYHVTSTSFTSATENTTAEAYIPRGVKRYLSGNSGASTAIQGDYIAIGNSLMTCCWTQQKTTPPPGQGCYQNICTTCCGNNPYRNYAPAPVIFTSAAGYADGERESYATVSPGGVPPNVPSDAKIERAYLYWTAWLRGKTLWAEKGQGTWSWSSYEGDDTYWEAHAPQYVKDWLQLNAYDGRAYLAVNDQKVTPIDAGDPLGMVVANTWFISEGSSDVQPSYQYACFADVTAQVTEITEALSGAKFTVAGVHAHPAACADDKWNRSSNAGWSMIIIYSSAEKKTHQIYLYEGCEHLYNQTHEFTISGFAAPSDLEPGETNEAKMTVFASEGDANAAEYLGFQGQNTDYYQLYDVSNTTGVFNSISGAGGFSASTINTCQSTAEISGIDIDNYTYTHATEPPSGTSLSTIVHPGDTSANIKVQSTGDGLEVIYVVFSVRSTAIPAGQVFDVGSMLFRIQ